MPETSVRRGKELFKPADLPAFNSIRVLWSPGFGIWQPSGRPDGEFGKRFAESVSFIRTNFRVVDMQDFKTL